MYTRGSIPDGLLFSAALATALAGCAATPAGSTVQVMPGPGKSFPIFQADNNSCKAFAAQQVQGQAEAANQRAVGTALLTTVLGTGLGAATGGLAGNAGGGAAIGAAAGAGGGAVIGASSGAGDQAGIQQQYDIAFSQCMYSNGELVPGFAPVAGAGPVQYEGSAAPVAAVATADPTVRATQVELNRLGYLHGPADGVAGGRTRAAISSFEQTNGMPVDGTASPGLLAKLQATPSHAAAVTASAPSGWVAPASASASASSGWVAPAGSSTPPAPTNVAAPAAGWVAPTKTQ